MCWYRFLAILLVVIGALNWGLIGVFQLDLISNIFGGMDSTGARVIFAVIGLSGIYCISCLCCTNCKCGPKCKCGKK